MPLIQFRAQTPPEKLWLIFDCSQLTQKEIKSAFDLLRNSPSTCDREREQLLKVYRDIKSETTPEPILSPHRVPVALPTTPKKDEKKIQIPPMKESETRKPTPAPRKKKKTPPQPRKETSNKISIGVPFIDRLLRNKD